jgi:hypothetical protein
MPPMIMNSDVTTPSLAEEWQYIFHNYQQSRPNDIDSISSQNLLQDKFPISLRINEIKPVIKSKFPHLLFAAENTPRLFATESGNVSQPINN